MNTSDKRIVYLGMDNKIQVYLSKDMIQRPSSIKVKRLEDNRECVGEWTINQITGFCEYTLEDGYLPGACYSIE